ncbi:GDP-Man:Man(3)GlcNAc(2)-PP-Dol alpha-1,2-mannosyltransferase isoform X1 [Toxorhynchites rutilus septentrionalis]|uniref:GDP-Man:Man(3)GlcNAc(2)-PP-Dol alpha-1,2-mannosyltransferase isoform X1 n=2 Tax=Toxorhynchites rutilus septentrionalis TaxID=329112 RepID=UPI002479645E|nr:GDP-Man:Man(3)GlcNAc(2)-PP-Dol alpha-1,2-mannosyltransferase isoform X1 [Toxorhynchites rutilus septentrionalis]
MFCLCSIVYVMLFASSFSLIGLLTVFLLLRQLIKKQKNNRRSNNDNDKYVALFHPYCNAGGGGERVLWCAVRALQNKYDGIKIFIYTGDLEATPKQILDKAERTFNLNLDVKRIKFVYLKKRKWVEAKRYPMFTLLGQSLGSMFLAMEALLKLQPDVFIDTMGYAFTYPIFSYIGGCKIGCYTHYPTISTDMLRRVQNNVNTYNNQGYVAKNPFATWLKIVYYRLFSKIYGMVGRCADTVMVNSTWTENHIISLWDVPYKTHRVYPPCEVAHLKKLQSLASAHEKIIILSVGQFRPEKDHPLQLQAMYELRTLLGKDEALWNRLRLMIVGSCRDEEDRERVKNMQDLAKHLSLENSVEFRVNVSYQELIQCYQIASIGLHAMWNEHFGISVVDCMAAGLIMVANRSGGPLMDIVETSEGSRNGYLALDAYDYARYIATILYNGREYNKKIREAARASVDRFSEVEFENGFLRAISTILDDKEFT